MKQGRVVEFMKRGQAILETSQMRKDMQKVYAASGF